MGIDYHPGISNLIVSVNYSGDSTQGVPVNFARLDSSGNNNAWTTLGSMGPPDTEIKLATVKTTANGWTQGDMYFGTGQGGVIGRISANGSTVNTNWATLTNATQMVGETNFPGGLYLDQSGVFGGNLIVVSSGGGGVWRVTSSGAATRVAQINDVSGKLEGVVTVPNDSSKYGPWAGKILTCGEVAQLTYAVDANGNVTPYDFTMPKPEDVRLVAAGQNLYCLDEPNNLVLKVPQSNFSSFAGDVLLVDEQEASLLLVHWTGGQFVTRKIFPGANALEHVAFAPIDIPPLP